MDQKPIVAHVVEAGDVENSEWNTVSNAAVVMFDSEAELDAALKGEPVKLRWPTNRKERV